MATLNLGELVGIIRADDSGMRRGLSDAMLRMRGFQRDTEGRLRTLDGRFARVGSSLGRGFRRADADGGRFRAGLGRIAGMAGRLGGVAVAVGGIAAKLGAALPLAAGLAATVGAIAPAAAVAASGMLAIKLASTAVKLGMVGVEDAVSSALDPEKAEEFNEALKKLAPSARAFALEVKKLAPAFRELQQDVQQRLFQGFDKTLKDVAKATLPALRTGLLDAASAVNAMGRNVGYAAVRMGRNGTLGQAIKGATDGLKNMSRVPGQIVTGLTQIAAAAAPTFSRLTAAAGGAFDKLAQRMDKAFASGAMQQAIERAVALLGDLWDVAKNVGSIFSSIFDASSVTGGGLIGALKEITGALSRAFASPEVQAGLRAIFGVMSELARAAAPILVSLFKTLGKVFEKLGPPLQLLVQHLGAGLLKIMDALSPVLVVAAEAFGELIIAALPLIDLAAELIAAFLPVLVPVFETFAKILKTMQPFIAKLADAVAAFLLPILETLATKVMPVLLPPFVKLAETVMPVLTEAIIALTPGLTDLAVAFSELLAELAPVIAQVLLLGVALLEKLLPYITPVIVGLALLVSKGLSAVAYIIREWVVPAVRTIAALLRGDFSGAMKIAREQAQKAVDGIRDGFNSMKDKAIKAVADMGVKVVENIRLLPGAIRGALGAIGNVLFSSGQSVIQGLIDGIVSKIHVLKATLKGVTNLIPSWKGPAATDAKLLTPAGQMLIQGLQRGIDSQVPALRAQLQGITGSVPGMALAGVPAGAATRGSGGGRTVLEIRSDGSRASDFIVQAVREAVQVRGHGSVEATFR